MTNFDTSKKTQESAVAKRRGFLKKSFAGAALASLPAKSVWGACSVSGAMSGNLSQNVNRHDCSLPPIMLGRSPNYWATIDQAKTQSVFTSVDANNAACALGVVKNHRDSQTMGLPSQLLEPGFGDQISLALRGNYDLFLQNLAGVYMNHYFGFYGSGGDAVAASDFVKQILLYYVTEINQGGSPVINWNFVVDSDSNVTSGYVFSQC